MPIFSTSSNTLVSPHAGFGAVKTYCSTISSQKSASGPQILTHDAEASQCSSAGDESGISFLQQATGDYDLHTRLAALWSMPSELLFERQQAVAKMLGPAGCGTASHALWVSSSIRWGTVRHCYGQCRGLGKSGWRQQGLLCSVHGIL